MEIACFTFYKSCVSGHDMTTEQICGVFLGNDGTNDSPHPLLSSLRHRCFISLEIHRQVKILWASWKITPSDTACNLDGILDVILLTSHHEDLANSVRKDIQVLVQFLHLEIYNMLLHFIRLLQLILTLAACEQHHHVKQWYLPRKLKTDSQLSEGASIWASS